MSALWLLLSAGNCDPLKHFTIPDDTLSPDGRYGVAVPTMDDEDKISDPRNKLVEISTKRIIATIENEPGWDQQNHGGALPARWSEDSSLLLWEVDGKWFPRAVALLKFNNEVAWQLDILKAGQEAILAATRKAASKQYARIKADHKKWGSAYPEGFSVDVYTTEPISLPLTLHIDLTSDPKGASEEKPLESHMTATVDKDGKFTVISFGLGRGKTPPRAW